MSEHTQGPWHITGTYCERWIVDSKSPPTGKQNLIAILLDHWAGNKPDAMDVNARLIAAAPQMLEALEAAISALEDASCLGFNLTEQIKKVDAAIRAAKGEV